MEGTEQQGGGTEGQQLTNVSTEQLGVQDEAKGNAAPAGEGTQNTGSNSESSTGDQSGSAEGEQPFAAGDVVEHTDGTRMTVVAVSDGIVQAQHFVDNQLHVSLIPVAELRKVEADDSGKADAGASAAGAPANTSGDAPSESSSSSTQLQQLTSGEQPPTITSSAASTQSQDGPASIALPDASLEAASASTLTSSTAIAGSLISSPNAETLRAGDSPAGETPAQLARGIAAAGHPAHAHLAEILETARGMAAIPELFISYLETKIRVLKDVIHAEELKLMAEQI